MIPSVRIVGQGIAGTLLAWACEQRGINWQIFDQGHAVSASRVGAGLVSPLTGLRLAPTWRFAEWEADARRVYREIEDQLGEQLLWPLQLRRLYRDDRQRERMEARLDEPEVAAWVESADEEGVWLRGAFRVDTARLIGAMRARWIERGKLIERAVALGDESDRPTIWCVGAGVTAGWAAAVKWELSKGELLTGKIAGVADDVVRNDGEWILPLGAGRVRVGATFNRDDLALVATAEAESKLRAAAQRLSGGAEIADASMDVGLRVNVSDRRPVVGWEDAAWRRGVFGGLAAKGALWAPILAEQWARDGLAGNFLEEEVGTNRFKRS